MNSAQALARIAELKKIVGDIEKFTDVELSIVHSWIKSERSKRYAIRKDFAKELAR